VDLAGAVLLDFLDPFQPRSGDEYLLVTSEVGASFTGEVFAAPPLPEGLDVQVETVGTDLLFRVVPEPSAIASALAAFAVLSMLARTRR
jgi:hypothetical protein